VLALECSWGKKTGTDRKIKHKRVKVKNKVVEMDNNAGVQR